MTHQFPDSGRDNWTASDWQAYMESLTPEACACLAHPATGARYIIRPPDGQHISAPMSYQSATVHLARRHRLQQHDWARAHGYNGDAENQPYEQAIAAGLVPADSDPALIHDGSVEQVFFP